MSARVTWSGLQELYDGLRNLPSDLAGGAGPIVLGKAEEAGQDIRPAYPRRSGNLADHVKVESVNAGTYGAAARVRNTAKHAAIFENGTQARHTDLGANRGSMPPGHIFVPIVIKKRREMYEELKGLLEQQGLNVSGDA